MNKDKALETYLRGGGKLIECHKCGDILVVDKSWVVCLNEECDYQLVTLEGGRNNEELQS